MDIDCVDGEQPSWAEIPIDVMPGTKYFAIAADKDAKGDIHGEVRFITFSTKQSFESRETTLQIILIKKALLHRAPFFMPYTDYASILQAASTMC